jgi:5'-deoxynucleotidase
VSHLFAYLARMKFIKRWGLMHTTYPESIQEHSHRVAVIAHTLATIRNRLFGGRVDAARAAVLALYHDAGEVLTGDLPAPVKYFNPDIRGAYREIEAAANQRLLAMVPAALREEYRPLFTSADGDHDCWELVKAADKLCAYLKCVEEVAAGNREFSRAEQALRATVDALPQPEVRYFLETFAPSLKLTLDELG